MQLTSQTSIRNTVTALTATLLGVKGAAAAGPLRTDASILLYNETDRVTTGEGALSFHKQIDSKYSLGLRLTYDALTGASPNGATPSSKLQTFTGPSGETTTRIQPGQIPLDPTFRDNRFAASADLSRLLDRLTTVSLGSHLSFESDYSSLGFNAGITRDFFQKNTTLGLSGSFSHDIVNPNGGVPIGLSVVPPPDTTGGDDDDDEGEGDDDDGRGSGIGSDTKNVVDFVLGLSQVVNRSTVVRMNYSFDRASGYQNDPYKIVSVVQSESGLEPGDATEYLYERRPDARSKSALFGEVLKSLGRHTLDLSYRYFWDTWGIKSNTAEVSFAWRTKRGMAIEPHLRWYHQSRADFYHPFLVQGDQLPAYASADSRLADLDAYTVGLKYSFPAYHDSRISLSGEYYFQRGDQSPPEAFGTLRNYALFPDMNAFMLRVGLAHGF